MKSRRVLNRRRDAVLAALLFSAALGYGVALASITINAQGTYRDLGVWLYKSASGFGFGPANVGTNEHLDMPSPSPPTGASVAGVEVIRHSLDTLGYPLHISLVDKLYAVNHRMPIFVSNNSVLWSYTPGDPVAQERSLADNSVTNVHAVGPLPANGAIPDQYQAAFAYAKSVLASISNLPDSQKSLGNYAVLFIDDGATTWIELGPAFGPKEAEHLGCQTEVGRDMVMSMRTVVTSSGSVTKGGAFLQCF